jgi:hypothetical protein
MPEAGKIEIDFTKLQQAGIGLAGPAERLIAVGQSSRDRLDALKTQDGLPPWGDGKLGEAFTNEYFKIFPQLLQNIVDMGIGLRNVMEKFGISSSQYMSAEGTNTELVK